MFSLIESSKEIAKAQRKLEATIRRDFKKKAVRNIGYPSGTTYDANITHNRGQTTVSCYTLAAVKP